MRNERNKYAYEADLGSDSAPARVIRMVGQEKRVLEIGSGPGSITRLLTSASRCRVTALDIDINSLQELAPHCEQVYQADLDDPTWPMVLAGDGKFEVLVAADVLEHVYDPKTVLRTMAAFLIEDGYMVISMPHVGHSAIHACLLDENFEYSEFGLLDRTHIRFFGIKNMQQLFEDANLKIVQAEFVVRNPEYTEFANRWAKLSPQIRNALATNPFGLVYQVVVKAVRQGADGTAISLMALPIIAKAPSTRDSLKSALRTYLSVKTYSRLRMLASKLGMRFKG